MPLPSLSSRRGVTGCSFSLWLGLSQERVKDGWMVLPGTKCQLSGIPCPRDGENPLLIQPWQDPNILQPCEKAAQPAPPQAVPWLQNRTSVSCTTLMKYPWSSVGLGDSWKSFRFLLLNELLAQLQSGIVLHKFT